MIHTVAWRNSLYQSIAYLAITLLILYTTETNLCGIQNIFNLLKFIFPPIYAKLTQRIIIDIKILNHFTNQTC